VNAWTVMTATVPLIAGVSAWGMYHPRSQLFGPTVRRIDSRTAIALTFDDGPNPAATPRILDVLEKYQAQATFFVIGRWARAFPNIVASIAARGHTLGNHSDTHQNLAWMSRTRIAAELRRCQDAVEHAAGNRPLLLRPPFGYRSPHLHAAATQTGLRRVVMWTMLGHDWSEKGQGSLVAALSRRRGGDIIALHDGDHRALGADRTATVDAVEYWLPRWHDAGYRCVALNG
jgi:peptidoglycan/xylan/chitin deacetylase (PgdA/CDA1 family)